jgi:hypothetical protein
MKMFKKIDSSSPPVSETGSGMEKEFSSLDREVVFYYNRERRLERASAAVRELNKPGPPMRGGPIRALTATKPLTILFLTVVLLVIMSLVMSYRAPVRGGKTLGGNTIRASATVSEGSSFVTFKKTIASKENPYTGAVDIAVSSVLTSQEKQEGIQAPISAQRVFFTLEKEEEYRLAVPFTAEELLILMQGGEQRVTFRIRPE